MSFIMFASVGTSVGIFLYALAKGRFDVGRNAVLAGSLFMGLLGAFAGGVIGNLLAGQPLTTISVGSAGGTGIGGLLTVLSVALAAHFASLRHAEQGPLPPMGDHERATRGGAGKSVAA